MGDIEEYLPTPLEEGRSHRASKTLSQNKIWRFCLLPYLYLLNIEVFAHFLQTSCTLAQKAKLQRLILEHLGFVPSTSQRIVVIDWNVHDFKT